MWKKVLVLGLLAAMAASPAEGKGRKMGFRRNSGLPGVRGPIEPVLIPGWSTLWQDWWKATSTLVDVKRADTGAIVKASADESIVIPMLPEGVNVYLYTFNDEYYTFVEIPPPGGDAAVPDTMTFPVSGNGVHDFGDGRGLIAAYRHTNPDGSEGGWVEDSDDVLVTDTAYVGPDAEVFGAGTAVYGASPRIEGTARVWGGAQVHGHCRIYGDAWVAGGEVLDYAEVGGRCMVGDDSVVKEDGQVGGDSQVLGSTVVGAGGSVTGNSRLWSGTVSEAVGGDSILH